VRWFGLRLVACLGACAPVAALSAQAPDPQPAARGLYNWVHTTADAERAFEFYRDVLGVELAPSPFVPSATNAPPEGIRPVAQAGSDALVWDLTNTHGSRFRTVFMRVANTPFGLELAEFFDIPRETRAANPWDPGASRLIFAVRDLDSIVAALAARGAPIVTLGGAPVDTPAGRAIVVRDPDGYLIELRQAAQAAIARVESVGPVIETSIGLTVADVRTALVFYEDLLGFEVRDSAPAVDAELRLNGLAGGAFAQTRTSIPRIGASVVLSEYELPTGAPAAQPFRWRIQDVGAPQFQLEVAGLGALLERTTAAGYRFLSVGGKPIQRPFGRFVFAIDPDGVLVEYVEPTVAR
jgi:catechol 2,3-dioxygenase-like lactoylglutathione lyase family enzyme